MEKIILQSNNLSKTFLAKKKEEIQAVKNVTLEVRAGEIFGFLGPNGAGKSTTLDMLTTLLTPTNGEATICGFDLLRKPQNIRQHIGYVSQSGGVDSDFNAYDNLVLQARLYGMNKARAIDSTNFLIKKFQLSEFAHRKTNSYSGGQKRRVELALGIIHKPKLLFLDEPTQGLDPQSRAYFWQEIKKIKEEGMTIFLTTHYLEEADNLCDRIAIIDHGTIIDIDTPVNMKKQIGSETITVDLLTYDQAKAVEQDLSNKDFIKKISLQDKKITLFVENGVIVLPKILSILSSLQITAQNIGISQPSLDDVFLQKTGKSLRETKN